MSLWSQRMREWVDVFFARHDDAYLAEKLARACEYWGESITRSDAFRRESAIRDALREYRARNPRGDA